MVLLGVAVGVYVCVYKHYVMVGHSVCVCMPYDVTVVLLGVVKRYMLKPRESKKCLV